MFLLLLFFYPEEVNQGLFSECSHLCIYVHHLQGISGKRVFLNTLTPVDVAGRGLMKECHVEVSRPIWDLKPKGNCVRPVGVSPVSYLPSHDAMRAVASL